MPGILRLTKDAIGLSHSSDFACKDASLVVSLLAFAQYLAWSVRYTLYEATQSVHT